MRTAVGDERPNPAADTWSPTGGSERAAPPSAEPQPAARTEAAPKQVAQPETAPKRAARTKAAPKRAAQPETAPKQVTQPEAAPKRAAQPETGEDRHEREARSEATPKQVAQPETGEDRREREARTEATPKQVAQPEMGEEQAGEAMAPRRRSLVGIALTVLATAIGGALVTVGAGADGGAGTSTRITAGAEPTTYPTVGAAGPARPTHDDSTPQAEAAHDASAHGDSAGDAREGGAQAGGAQAGGAQAGGAEAGDAREGGAQAGGAQGGGAQAGGAQAGGAQAGGAQDGGAQDGGAQAGGASVVTGAAQWIDPVGGLAAGEARATGSDDTGQSARALGDGAVRIGDCGSASPAGRQGEATALRCALKTEFATSPTGAATAAGLAGFVDQPAVAMGCIETGLEAGLRSMDDYRALTERDHSSWPSGVANAYADVLEACIPLQPFFLAQFQQYDYQRDTCATEMADHVLGTYSWTAFIAGGLLDADPVRRAEGRDAFNAFVDNGYGAVGCHVG